ncbi:ComEC/Rec2 family competence protein [Caproicibacter fermentans]|uniref:Metallo-beta-lactamase domain-containing protein n=1 Tax=Caproicibacter fermentans TaxID=2576756 RepID=A0A7G8TE83_9FIRM|nr:hypothetical protein [Caproicibacter fermentans]QNK41924.1 hypothetical protein HCR03_06740 [Caproicibacter fermentans]
MRWIDLHDVGWGECIVLGGDRGGILMVDCGSSNLKLGENGPGFYEYVADSIIPRYREAESRSFFLTHCHRDHLCGLWRILEAAPGYFGALYLPVPPGGEEGRPILLEFALYAAVFLSRLTGYARVNVSVLTLFTRAARRAGAGAVFPVREGDGFFLDGAEYEVIWPPETGFVFPPELTETVDALDAMLSAPFLPPCAREFLALRERFCASYHHMCSASPVRGEDAEETRALYNRIEALIPELLLLPCAGDAAALLAAGETQDAYSGALNAACAVFQNVRRGGPGPDDILMTGDAPPESILAASARMYDGYSVLKAPHHGTAGYFFPLEIAADHILISNGPYRGGGEIASGYAELPAVRHCSGNAACSYYKEYGSCCNRLALCGAPPGGAILPVRCPAAARPGARPPCRVRVVSREKNLSCLCDAGRRAQKNF